MASSLPTAVSAPGKVLLAGGYTVLDPACRGLVLALSARIHCVATSSSASDNTITVRSPQFKDAFWEYKIEHLGEGRGVSVTQVNDGDANPFILTTITYVLSYLSLLSIPSTTLTILASNSYYSQPTPHPPRFNNLAVPIKSANKTGLGSSAALVTSLTACLLHHFSPSKDVAEKHIIHNLAQTSHCAAQGKVGSGFDVAAATYGSCQYQRFRPEILSSIPDPSSSSQTFVSSLQSTVNSKWEMTCEPVTLPKGLGLIMGDVQCGSSTPGMVKTVLGWRKSSGDEGEEVWSRLDSRNRALITAIENLGDSTTLNENEKNILKERIGAIRQTVRELGSKAGVEIEPESQTKLIDAASASSEDKTNNIIGGVVPGAGGYDAVAFLYVDEKGTRERLESFLGEYKLDNGFVKVLEAGQEPEGVKVEDVKGYKDVIGYFEGVMEL
ncbi:hypothetical protein ABW20_dc0105306 [Dactylellina cionopaga]|nr:hypothetical protein ABW20_dc0105306 [Dactylellina cionopaga]